MYRNRTTEEKLALLELSDKLNNVSAACKSLGFGRDSYYRIKRTYDKGGVEALRNQRRRASQTKGPLLDAWENAVMQISLKNPLLDAHKVSKILGQQEIKVSPAIVSNVWKNHGMATLEERVDKLFEHFSIKEKCVLNEEQIKACRKALRNREVSRDKRHDFEVAERSLEKRLQFETLISRLSAQFINLPVDQIDEEIERGQKLVCESLSIHRSTVGEFQSNYKSFKVTHSWTTPGIPHNDRLELASTEDSKYVINSIQKGDTLIISDLEALPETTGRLKHTLQKMGVTSVVAIPLKVGAEVVGGVSWESCGIKKDWPDLLVERLRLISEVFANALSRKRTEQALRNSITEIKKLKDQLQAENLYLLDEIRFEHKHHRIIGRSNSIKKVLSQIEQVAGTPSTVLIQGETGTGKELVARAIHDLSSRKDRPMVKVNCSSLPVTLIESELFGHEKGAFSGAVSRRMGSFEVANGSTIFLDEIGELPLELQSKLLRVLQEGQFERLGSTKTITIDGRVIAATNQELEKLVFRKDLYYRLNVFPITMPPLRERPDDIPLLVKNFAQEFSRQMGKNISTISERNLEALKRYHWP